MATFSILTFTIPILLISLSLMKPISSIIQLPNFPHFDPHLLLIGDAHTQPINPTSSVQLTVPNSSPSSGLLIRRKPFKFRSSTKPLSFSTDFIFSISSHNGDGLALIMVPSDFPPKFSRESFGLSRENRFFGVEFDTLMNGNVGDKNGNHVGVDVGSLDSEKISNVSSINLVLNSGIKLHSWVDYDSSSKRLEVRLCKFGNPRPYDPLLAHRIDLGEMWRGEEVLVGLSSSSGHSMQRTNVYSWKFRVRSVPKGLHSQPVNPQDFSIEHGRDKMVKKKKLCALRILSGLVFATGCGLLAAFAVLFLWTLFAKYNKDQIAVIPVKCSGELGDFRYEKINLVLEDSLDNVKK